MFEIKSNAIAPTQGRLLLSEPLLRDFYFRRSVILLIDHSDDGSFGVIINKPLKMTLNEVVSGIPEFNAPVYIGGPVDSDKVFFLHTLGDEIPDSVQVNEEMYWGGNLEALTEKIKAGLVDSKDIRFFLGYSGWTSNQLNDEIKSNSWAVAIPKPDMIMKLKPEQMWNKYVGTLGKDYRFWLHMPKDPMLN
ncbi:MAG: YqgE/AlgH family protein [Bacteroidales bacterium]|nr:YqgE/AlgH family protein [Bacteroidales bacterium]